MKYWRLVFFSFALSGCAMLDTTGMPEIGPEARVVLADSDKDGVIDARDECNDTRIGANIGYMGCNEFRSRERTYSQVVLFGFNSAELSRQGTTAIDAMIKRLPSSATAWRVSVAGFASSEGNVEYNKQLSAKRTNQVTQYLRRKLPQAEFVAESFGEAQLAVSENDESTRAFNRRVTIIAKVTTTAAGEKWHIYITEGR